MKKWQGIIINEGEFITSFEKLSIETGLSISKVRTAIKKLQSTKAITTYATSKYSVIRVNSNFNKLNDNPNDLLIDKQIISKSQPDNNQIATTNNNIEISITKRKIRFREEVFSHTKYNKELLNSFFNYWNEQDKKGLKMRFETHEFWNLENRIKKWAENERPKIQTNKTTLHKNR